MPPPADAETEAWFAGHVRTHEPMLRGYLRSIALPADVDDLVQETYARLLRAREQGPIRSIRGLLFAVARNAARDIARRRARNPTTPLADHGAAEFPDSAPAAPEIVSRRQELELLAGAIGALPERCRAVFVLRRYEGLSQREIATRLGIAEHTVEIHLLNALRRCEAYFRRQGYRPSP